MLLRPAAADITTLGLRRRWGIWRTAYLRRGTSKPVSVLGRRLGTSEIAEKLFISPKTASVHVSRILTKLGVNSRAKATAIAYEERLLTDTT